MNGADRVMDIGTILERLDGDEELLRELAQLFLEEVPTLLSTIRGAVEHGNGRTLQQAAHSLKGAASNLAASAVCEAARRLEFMGRDGDLAYGPVVCAELEKELARLEDVLVTLG